MTYVVDMVGLDYEVRDDRTDEIMGVFHNTDRKDAVRLASQLNEQLEKWYGDEEEL